MSPEEKQSLVTLVELETIQAKIERTTGRAWRKAEKQRKAESVRVGFDGKAPALMAAVMQADAALAAYRAEIDKYGFPCKG